MKKQGIKFAAILCLVCIAATVFVSLTVFRASAAENTVFHLLGPMPQYTETTRSVDGKTIYGYVTLPNISATFEGGNADKIDCVVTDPNGVSVEVYSAGEQLPDSYNGSLVGHQFMFEAVTDGIYIVNYTATRGKMSETIAYSIKAGDISPPHIACGIGYINGELCDYGDTVYAYVNEIFDFAAIEVIGESSLTNFKFNKKLIAPDNETIAEVTEAAKKNNGSPYLFTRTGTYRVVYSATDAAGNECVANYYITVTAMEKYDMSGVGFAGQTFIYDGKPHGITVTDLPDDVSVTYINNDKTEPGTYVVVAEFSVSDKKYGPIRAKTAVLTIEKAPEDIKVPDTGSGGCGSAAGVSAVTGGAFLLGIGGLIALGKSQRRS